MIWPGLIAALQESEDLGWSFTCWNDQLLDEGDQRQAATLELFMVRIDPRKGCVQS